jgi:hypothetical protein
VTPPKADQIAGSATLDDSTRQPCGSLSATKQIASIRAVDPDPEMRVARVERAQARDVEGLVAGRAHGVTLHRESVSQVRQCHPTGDGFEKTDLHVNRPVKRIAEGIRDDVDNPVDPTSALE